MDILNAPIQIYYKNLRKKEKTSAAVSLEMDAKSKNNYSSGYNNQSFNYNQNFGSNSKALSDLLGPKEQNKSYTGYNNKSAVNPSSNLDTSNYSNSFSSDSYKYLNSSNPNSYTKQMGFSDGNQQRYQPSNQLSVNSQIRGDSANKYSSSDLKSNETNFTKKKDQFNGKNETLSWTKYIAMEFKIEELEKKVSDQQKDITEKASKIYLLEKNLREDKAKYQKIIKELQTKYQNQLLDQKNAYQSRLQQKRTKIVELIDKVMDETKNSLSQQMKRYVEQILNKNVELTSILETAAVQKESSAKKATKHEEQQLEKQAKIKQLSDTIVKLEGEMSQLAQRFLSRSSVSHDSNSCMQVIQAQAAQISQLRNNYETLQNQFLKIRSTQIEAGNKLKNFQNQHSKNRIIQKNQQNRILTDLGIVLTRKQNQVNSIKRALTILERKYNAVQTELKAKNQLIQNYAGKPKQDVNENYAELFKQIIDNDLNSVRYEQEIASLKKRISLLQN